MNTVTILTTISCFYTILLVNICIVTQKGIIFMNINKIALVFFSLLFIPTAQVIGSHGGHHHKKVSNVSSQVVCGTVLTLMLIPQIFGKTDQQFFGVGEGLKKMIEECKSLERNCGGFRKDVECIGLLNMRTPINQGSLNYAVCANERFLTEDGIYAAPTEDFFVPTKEHQGENSFELECSRLKKCDILRDYLGLMGKKTAKQQSRARYRSEKNRKNRRRSAAY